MKNKINWGKIDWVKEDGLMPAIIQDSKSSKVLMLGYVSEESLVKTVETGKVWFYSRSKKRLWMKGESSKNYLYVDNIFLDCDGDALLITVSPNGPACHTLRESCFDVSEEKVEQKKTGKGALAELYDVLETRRREMPEKSYTTKLFLSGIDKLGAKVMEESAEVYQSASKDTKQRLIEESSDLFYHLLALLVYKEVSLEEVWEELEKRRGLSLREFRKK